MGFSIALDDLGAGYSSLRLWSELRPDYVKIDRHFIDGIHQDTVKREFVGSILKMAKASRAQVIAEGIELPEELAVLAEMGVDLLQGYLLCRPQEQPPRDAINLLPSATASSPLSEEASDLRGLLNPFANELFSRKPISRLMSDDYLAVESSQSLQQVSRLLTSRARQRIEEDFIIIEDGCYVGLGRVIDVTAV